MYFDIMTSKQTNGSLFSKMKSCSLRSLLSSSQHSRGPSSLTEARSKSFGQLPRSVGLQIEKLEALLIQTAPDFCEDKLLIKTIKDQFVGLSARKHFRNDELTRQEMSEIVDILNSIIASSPLLRPKLVAHVHSMIGLLQQLIGENDSAIASLTKALWIETSIKCTDDAEIGLTLHRLGNSHARNGNYSKAIVMLKKSLVIYQLAGLDRVHPYVTTVIGEIDLVQKKSQRKKTIYAASA
jgi:tetratricopeptide (TPR) repeat protein